MCIAAYVAAREKRLPLAGPERIKETLGNDVTFNRFAEKRFFSMLASRAAE